MTVVNLMVTLAFLVIAIFVCCESFRPMRSFPKVSRTSMKASWFENIFSFWKKGPESSLKIVAQPDAYLRKVLVFGSTGRCGFQIVSKLLEANENNFVICAVKNETKAIEIYKDLIPTGRLQIAKNCDVLDINSLGSELFEGVSVVVSSIGPSFNNVSLSSENVDYLGNVLIMKALAAHRTGISAEVLCYDFCRYESLILTCICCF